MTTIKVGEYEVWPCVKHHGWQVRTVHDVIVDCRNTLPMALRVAAEAAGIERQRVEIADYTVGGVPVWVTYPPGEQADESGHLSKLMDRAHKYAREQYAALGGAA